LLKYSKQSSQDLGVQNLTEDSVTACDTAQLLLAVPVLASQF